MSKITRQKAAQLLGVSEQTISNYYKDGLLGGAKGRGGILYINEDDLNRLAQEYKMTAASERLLKLKQEQLRADRAKVDEEEAKLRDVLLLGIKGYDRDFIVRIISNVFRSGMIPGMKKREKEMLCDFIGGRSFKYIAELYNLSYARVQQVVNNAMQRLESTAEISENLRTNWELEQENSALKKEIAMLKEKYESDKVLPGDDMRYITTILSTRLVDLELNVRIFNCLYHQGEMETIDDLLKVPKTEILKFRNLGKKSFSELVDVIEGKLGLIWRNYDEPDADFYERLIKHMRRKDKLA